MISSEMILNSSIDGRVMLSTIISIHFISSIILSINSISTLNSSNLTHNLSWLRRFSQSITWYIETCRESSWSYGVVVNWKLYIINDLRAMNWTKGLMNPGANESVILMHMNLSLISIKTYKPVFYINQVLDQRLLIFEKVISSPLSHSILISFNLICSYIFLFIIFIRVTCRDLQRVLVAIRNCSQLKTVYNQWFTNNELVLYIYLKCFKHH